MRDPSIKRGPQALDLDANGIEILKRVHPFAFHRPRFDGLSTETDVGGLPRLPIVLAGSFWHRYKSRTCHFQTLSSERCTCTTSLELNFHGKLTMSGGRV